MAHVTGLLAGYGVTVMVALMARVPALEHGIGADRLSRWHALGGRTILVLILVHGVAATISTTAAHSPTHAARTMGSAKHGQCLSRRPSPTPRRWESPS